MALLVCLFSLFMYDSRIQILFISECQWRRRLEKSRSINAIGIGLTLGWNSPTFAKLLAPDSPIPIGPGEVSTLAAMVGIGHTVGPLITAQLIDRIGRKNTMLLGGVPSVIAWVMIIFGKNVMVLYVARFIAGFGFGCMVFINPIYLGEILSVRLRGAMAVMVHVMVNVGLVLVTIFAPHLSIQLTASISLLVAVIFLTSFWFMPESPYYLVMRENFDEAEAALEKIRGKIDVVEELALIKATVNRTNDKQELESSEKVSPDKLSKPSATKLLVSVAGNRKAMYIMMLFALVPPFSGFGSIVTYGHIVFADMGTQIPVDVCLLIFTLIQLITITVTSFVVDKFGRRSLICVSGILSCACLGIISTYFYMLEYLAMDVTRYSIIPVGASFVLVFALNFGLKPTATIIGLEIFATDIKALGQCINNIYSGIIHTAAIKLYLIMVKSWDLGHSVPFFGFAVIIGSVTGLLMWKLPETKGKTLLEIQNDLNS